MKITLVFVTLLIASTSWGNTSLIRKSSGSYQTVTVLQTYNSIGIGGEESDFTGQLIIQGVGARGESGVCVVSPKVALLAGANLLSLGLEIKKGTIDVGCYLDGDSDIARSLYIKLK